MVAVRREFVLNMVSNKGRSCFSGCRANWFVFFGAALSSTFRFLFAGMRYEEFRAAGEVLGPIYYIVFKVCLIYMPMYTDTYTDI